MKSITYYYPKTGFTVDDDLTLISDKMEQSGGLLWADIENPTDEDLRLLADEFGWHPLVVEDLFISNERPKINQYENMVSIVLYTAQEQKNGNPENEAIVGVNMHRLYLMFSKEYVVTLHEGTCPVLKAINERWRKNTEAPPNDAGMLTYSILDSIIDDYFPIIDDISVALDEIEDKIFAGADSESLKDLFQLKKDMLAFRRHAAPLRDVVNVLLRREQGIISEHAIYYYQDLYDHLVRITDSIDTYRDLLSSSLDTYLSVSSNRLAMSANRLNLIMQTLTAWSIILMTAALITGFYGMNFQWMPELKWGIGHLWALILMIVSFIGLFYFFKKKEWI